MPVFTKPFGQSALGRGTEVLHEGPDAAQRSAWRSPTRKHVEDLEITRPMTTFSSVRWGCTRGRPRRRCSRRSGVVPVRVDIGPRAVIAGVAADAEDLHGQAFVLRNVEEGSACGVVMPTKWNCIVSWKFPAFGEATIRCWRGRR